MKRPSVIQLMLFLFLPLFNFENFVLVKKKYLNTCKNLYSNPFVFCFNFIYI